MTVHNSPFLVAPTAYRGEYFIVIDENYAFAQDLEQIKSSIRHSRFQPEDRAIGRFAASEVEGFLRQGEEFVGACEPMLHCK